MDTIIFVGLYLIIVMASIIYPIGTFLFLEVSLFEVLVRKLHTQGENPMKAVREAHTMLVIITVGIYVFTIGLAYNLWN